MPGVTKEQIKAAKKMTAIEFLRRYRPEELVKGECRNEYQLREHDSFKINGETSLWHWKSRDVGGRSALDYLILYVLYNNYIYNVYKDGILWIRGRA